MDILIEKWVIACVNGSNIRYYGEMPASKTSCKSKVLHQFSGWAKGYDTERGAKIAMGRIKKDWKEDLTVIKFSYIETNRLTL